jgi:hypothetical protein
MTLPIVLPDWIEDGEVGSETVLNRPLLQLLTNIEHLDNTKVEGAPSSTDKAIAVFDSTTGKIIQNSPVTITATGTLELPAGQSITVGGEAYASSKRFRVWMGL